ncbi:MAG: hypothetical protein H8D23_28615 [Candidatus Brocadiales bacterium]|nr:hypothetical protein [Candidatus Brocadiales bacterium]
MALSNHDLGKIKEMLGSIKVSGPQTPTEVKCNCKCKCITEAQVKNIVKGMDEKLNVIYADLQVLKNAAQQQ